MGLVFIISSVENLPVLQRFFQNFVYCYASFLQIVFIRCERFEIIFLFCYFNILFYNFLKSFKVYFFNLIFNIIVCRFPISILIIFLFTKAKRFLFIHGSIKCLRWSNRFSFLGMCLFLAFSREEESIL